MDYKDRVKHGRDKIRRAKVQLKFNLGTAVEDLKKMFL